jgi:hypothetical protein
LPFAIATAITDANVSIAVTLNAPTAVFVFTNVSLCCHAAAAAATTTATAMLPPSCHCGQVATALPAALLLPLMPPPPPLRCRHCPVDQLLL